MQLKVLGLRKSSILTMKLLILLIIVACFQVSARGFGQVISLSLQDAPLETAFIEIKKQSGYTFIYTRAQIKKALPVTVHIRNASLKETLRKCFSNQPLLFIIEDRYIIVQTKKSSQPPVANEHPAIDIRGKVINDKGEPVEGATLLVKGTDQGTTTNAEGYFELKGIEEGVYIIISGVNIQTTEVKVSGKSDLVIRVRTKITEGEAVIISTGFESLPKARATGSFATVTKDHFERRISTDVLSRLEGITSGLIFNKHPLLGTPELSIRGRSTIFANDQPLIVVDNFPYDGEIENINPNDLETITILKDAAAASIWGVRAGNGVIVITTKRGRNNQDLNIQVNTNFTTGMKPDLFYNPNFLNAKDFIELEKYLFDRGYYDADLVSLNYQPVSPVVEILEKQRAGQINQEQANGQINAFKAFDVRNDISRHLYRKSSNWQNSVNLSGGSKQVNYLFSFGYDKNKPSTIGSGFERITLLSNNVFNVTNKLAFDINLNYVQSVSKEGYSSANIKTGGPNGRNIYPYAQFADANGNAHPILRDYRSLLTENAEANGFLNWNYYPLKESGLYENKLEQFDTRVNTALRYNFSKRLKGEVRYQYQRFLTQQKDLAQQDSYYVRDLINQYSTVNSSGIVTKIDNIPIGDILDLFYSDQRSHNARAQLNFNTRWGFHKIDAIAGAEIREVNTYSNRNRLYGYNDDLSTHQTVEQPNAYFTLYPSGSSKTIDQGDGVGGGTDRFRSYFANVAYTLKQRYIFSASGRTDQSNFFGIKTNQSTVPLWSTGFKWAINEEKFYHINWLAGLSLRLTYGYNGNLDRSTTAVTTFAYSSTGAFQTGARYAEMNNIGNPLLRWEKTAMFNVGIDFKLNKGILSGSLEYFQKKGIDLMGDAPLPPSSGVTQLRGNFAGMRGQGIDIQLISNNINEQFKWQSLFILSYAADKVTKYDIKFPPSTYFAANGYNFNKYPIEGYPLYSVFSLPWGGLDPNNGDPRGYNSDTLTKNYLLLGTPGMQDLIYNGPARPVLWGGLTNTFNYKSLSFSFNVSFKFGYYFKRNSINYANLFNRWEGNIDYKNRWQNPGDENKTNVPSVVYPADPNRDQFYNNSEVLIEKGDHLRLQYLSLTYDLPYQLTSLLAASSARFSIMVNNVGILWRTNKHKIDPDFQASPFANNTVGIPTPRSISAGIKVNF